MSYTPGPWTWTDDGLEAVGSYVVTADVDLSNQHSPVVVVSNDADANIIAAAPQMFEALKSLENDNGQIPDFMWEMVQDAFVSAGGQRKETTDPGHHYDSYSD